MNERIPKRAKQILFMVAICIAPLIGTFLLLLLTRFGSGITQDSLAYVSMTRNLRQGEGIVADTVTGETELQTHYPPGVSLALSIIPFLDPKDGFVFLNAAVFFGFLLCIGLLAFRLTKSLPLTIAIQSLGIILPGVFRIFSMMWSEPLFLFLLVAGMLATVVAVQKQRKRGLLVAAGIWGYAMIVRYVGIVFLPFLLFVLWVGFTLPIKEKLKFSAMISAIVGLPIVVWYGIARIFGATESVREFGFTLIPFEKLTEGATTFFSWILPAPFVDIISSISVHVFFWGIVATLFAGFILYQREHVKIKEVLRFWIPLTFSLFYVAVVFFSILFLDSSTPLDFRLLSPISVMLLLGIMLAMQMLKDSRFYVKWAILAYFFVVFAWQTFPAIAEIYRDGLPYATAGWRHSSTVAYVRHSIPGNAVVYTHAPQALNVLSGKRVRAMPQKYSVGGTLVKEYVTNISRLRMNEEDQYLVFFSHDFALKARFATENEVLSILSLQKEFSSDEGAVYRIFPSAK
ncbi:MAG: hypothetical protein QY314_01740 [Candidatus Dojkabacteria bacterium]|nr:MAG: hypothetical protein QY314_01740 [Candidatus Dojkabacteria bacterium]